jgi:hypothetical protein
MRTVDVDGYPSPSENPSCHVNESLGLGLNPSNYAKRAVLRDAVLWFFPADHRGEVEAKYGKTVLYPCAYESKSVITPALTLWSALVPYADLL